MSRALAWIVPPRQRRSEERLEALLDVVEDLVEQGRFGDTAVAEIARRAGCTTGAVYARFRSKQDLLRALYARWAATTFATLAAFGDPARWDGVPLAEVVGALVEFLVTDANTRPGTRATFGRAAREDPELMRVRDELGDRVVATFEAFLAARRSEHARDDVHAAATVIYRLMGLLEDDLFRPAPRPRQFWRSELTRLILGALGAAH